jgi:hypothetical protein
MRSARTLATEPQPPEDRRRGHIFSQGVAMPRRQPWSLHRRFATRWTDEARGYSSVTFPAAAVRGRPQSDTRHRAACGKVACGLQPQQAWRLS